MPCTEASGKKPARKANWLEKMREKKEQRKPLPRQKQAADTESTGKPALQFEKVHDTGLSPFWDNPICAYIVCRP